MADIAGRKVFLGIGAIVTDVKTFGSEQCKIVAHLRPNHPSILNDSQRFFDIDMKLTPKESFANAKFDDNGIDADGNPLGMKPGFGVTSIGPKWPIGRFTGMVYVEKHHFNENINKIEDRDAKWPPMDYHAHELMTIVYENQQGPTRYAGFHAEMVTPAAGPAGDARIRVFRSGMKLLAHPVPVGEWPFTMGPRKQCDTNIEADVLNPLPGTDDLLKVTKLEANSAPGTQGAVFIDLNLVAKHYDYNGCEPPQGLVSPKIPFWLGFR